MITHLLGRIDTKLGSMSKGQKLIARFIEQHYDQAAFLTANAVSIVRNSPADIVSYPVGAVNNLSEIFESCIYLYNFLRFLRVKWKCISL